MTDDREKINQLVKAKTSSLQKTSSNIVSRGLSDLSLLTIEADDLKYTQSDAEAYNNRGNAYYDKGQYDRAIEDFNKAIALNPNSAEAYKNRGLAYNAKEQYDKAIEDFNKAIALNLNSAKAYAAYNNRGNAYYNKGQYDRAIENYDKAIALNPNSAEAYYNRELAYHSKGQYDMPIESYDKAIALNPNAAEAYNNRGTAYSSKGEYDRAIEDYDKAIALNLNYAKAYKNRGIAYEMLGNKSMAISDYRKACDLGLEIGCENLQRILQASELFKKEGQYRVNKESDKAIEPSQNRETTDSDDQKKYYYDNFAISSFFLTIGDVFHGKIHGEMACVVTGEISKGKLSVGDYVMILGLNEKPRNAIIKGIEINKELRESAKKGDIIGILFESEQNLLTVKKGDFVVNM